MLCIAIVVSNCNVECFQGAKVEIEAVAVVGHIVDQD